MLRIIAIAATVALAVPTLAVAQENNPYHPGSRKPPAGGTNPPRGRPFVAPPGPGRPGFAGGRPGGPPGPQFSYRGRMINRVHLAPFVYPSGFGYQRWGIGAALPPLFLVPAYFYADWATLGLAPPQPGFQWVRYGPDLLLVNIATGQVVDAVYGVFS